METRATLMIRRALQIGLLLASAVVAAGDVSCPSNEMDTYVTGQTFGCLAVRASWVARYLTPGHSRSCYSLA